MGPHALAVDGGNTKSLALVATLDGSVRGTGRSGCGDIYASTPEAALIELERAIQQAMSEAGVMADDLATAGFSLAGADWPEDFTFLEAEMRRHVGPATQMVVVNDSIGALRGGTADGEGVAVVCGTGTAIGARSGDRTWHTSFWGEDRGALAMGRAALRAMIRAELGIDRPTSLAGPALQAMGVGRVGDLLHAATVRGAPRTLLAGLAPVVLDAADAGEPVATRIVSDAGHVLGEYAGAAARAVGLADRPHTLVLTGGVFRHQSALLRAGILAALPRAWLGADPFEPVVGALFLALDGLDRSVDTAELRRTLPPSAWFASDPRAIPEVGVP